MERRIDVERIQGLRRTASHVRRSIRATLRAKLKMRPRRVGLDRQQLVAHSVIAGGGALVLVLFLWAHLGLGALLVPPAAGPREQVAAAGPYRLGMVLDAGVLTVGRERSATITLRDAAGRAVDDAAVRMQPVMLSMPMAVPPAKVDTLGAGRYRVHLILSMAGSWRLDVTITRPQQLDHSASFAVGVRWR